MSSIKVFKKRFQNIGITYAKSKPICEFVLGTERTTSLVLYVTILIIKYLKLVPCAALNAECSILIRWIFQDQA